MKRYVDWLKGLEREHKGKVVFVGYPAGISEEYGVGEMVIRNILSEKNVEHKCIIQQLL